MPLRSPRSLLLAVLTLTACSDPAPPPPGTSTPNEEVPVVPDSSRPVPPDFQPAEVVGNDTAPANEQGQPLSWPTAPRLTPVRVAARRDSVVVLVPEVAGARDYRVFRVPVGATVTADASGQEQVSGTTLYCAGFRQHNLPAGAGLELLRQIEVTDLFGPTRLVIEAVDRPCPFPGVLGAEHADFNVTMSEVPVNERGTYSLFTEAEQRLRYGSLIVNGHGPGARLGQPAEPVAPKVLARTTVLVAPSGTATPRVKDFFDDFRDGDAPHFVADLPSMELTQRGKRFQNARWNFHTYGAEAAQFFLDRGQLHTVVADWEQDIFASNIAYPRRVAKLSDTDYLHVTFEVGSNSTSRRYWWLGLCGAPTAGATMDAQGTLRGNIILSPFFHQPDGRNPSVEGWNCLQVFPRDGWPFDLGPSDSRPESDVRVMVNVAGRPSRDSVVNVSPDQYGNPSIGAPGWYRQQRADGTLVGPMLDDQLLIAPRTRFDVYIRRDRVVLYANGEQRLCNDFPSHKLTMAEAAVGFGHVLYHSAAERMEFRADYWDRTGQHYYLNNTPFIDARAWDSLGYEEGVGAPEGFNSAACYVHR